MTLHNKLKSAESHLEEIKQLLKGCISRESIHAIDQDLILERIRRTYEIIQSIESTSAPKPSNKSNTTEQASPPEPSPTEEESEEELMTLQPDDEIVVDTTKADITKMEDGAKQEGTQAEASQSIYKEEIDYSEEINETEGEGEGEGVEEGEDILEKDSSTKHPAEHKKQEQTDTAPPTPQPEEQKTINEENGKQVSEILSHKYEGTRVVRNETFSRKNKADVSSKLQNKPIDDLTKAIGINDKFLYTKELFNGNAGLYTTTIQKLNGFTDINDALFYIQDNFNWDQNNEAANQLIDLVRRKLLRS